MFQKVVTGRVDSKFKWSKIKWKNLLNLSMNQGEEKRLNITNPIWADDSKISLSFTSKFVAALFRSKSGWKINCKTVSVSCCTFWTYFSNPFSQFILMVPKMWPKMLESKIEYYSNVWKFVGRVGLGNSFSNRESALTEQCDFILCR